MTEYSAQQAPGSSSWTFSASQRNALHWVLVLLAAVFYVLSFVHLRADFPNFSPWNDWSKMTDEGWYGGGALHHFVQGHWFLPGSFNPAVAMPVWPIMLAFWFKLTGVSMVSARTLMLLVYGAWLVLLYVLMRRAAGELAAACALVLIALNPFCYAFDRLAILEPLLILWLLAGLLIASRTALKDTSRQIMLGIIIALLIFTKTTALFLVPALIYQVWASNGWPRHGWLRAAGVIGGSAAGIGLAYYLLAIRPHHLDDFRLLFSINHGRVHLSIILSEAVEVLRSGVWINPTLFCASLLAVAWAFTGARHLLRIPLFGSSVLATLGYLAFIGYHTNVQPRYYLVVSPAVVIVLVLAVSTLCGRRPVAPAVLATLVLTATALLMAARTLHYVAHPDYSFASAADDIAARIRAQPDSSPILLANSGDDISLFTGIPALTMEYSTHGIDPVLDRFHPGWIAIWSAGDDADHPLEAGAKYPWLVSIAARYTFTEVANYTIFDDPTRNRLFLYRLKPAEPAATPQVAGPIARSFFRAENSVALP